MPSLSPEDSKRITSLRFLLAVFVVFIHNCYPAQGFPVASKIQSLVSAVARSSVPLFFLFAAYLQAKKNEPYRTLIWKKARSLGVPFALWTAAYFFYYFGAKMIVAKIAPNFLTNPDKFIFSGWPLQNWLCALFIHPKEAMYAGWKVGMLAHYLWFLRDLMIVTLFSPLLEFLIKKFPRGLLTLIAIIAAFPFRIPFFDLSRQTMIFFPLGLYWGMYDVPLFKKIDKIRWSELLFLFGVSFVIVRVSGSTDAPFWCMVFLSCAMFLKFSGVIVRNENFFSFAKTLSGFSFFLYCLHGPVLNAVVAKFWIHAFPMKNDFLCLFDYFIGTLSTITLSVGISITLKTLCPPLFKIFNGGR